MRIAGSIHSITTVRCAMCKAYGGFTIAVVVPTSMLEHGGPVEVFSQFGYGQRLFVESLKLWSTLYVVSSQIGEPHPFSHRDCERNSEVVSNIFCVHPLITTRWTVINTLIILPQMTLTVMPNRHINLRSNSAFARALNE